MKGWDVYSFFDRLLNTPAYGERFEFHYIGNAPRGVKTNNIIYHKPVSGKALAVLLAQNHIYVTASVNEPAGMHHIEGACCGLPLVYRESGALPEYCNGFGAMYRDQNDLLPALNSVVEHYDDFYAAMPAYPQTSEKMGEEYYCLFNHLLSQRDIIYRRRGAKALCKSGVVVAGLAGYAVLNKLRIY